MKDLETFPAEQGECHTQVLPDSFSQALEHAALATHSAISDGANRCLVCFVIESWPAVLHPLGWAVCDSV